MKSRLILSAFLWLGGLFSGAQTLPDIENLSKEEAREALSRIAVFLSGNQPMNDRISEITGDRIEMNAIYENGVLTVKLNSNEIMPSSQEMGRFFYACNRDEKQLESSMRLAQLLRKAESTLVYRYRNDNGDSIDISLNPEELIDLRTKPVGSIGFDFQKLRTELIDMLDSTMKEPEEGVLNGEARIDGKYITLATTFSEPQDFLKDETPELDMRKLLLISIIAETGKSSMLMQSVFNVGRELGLAGLKLDYSDLTGRQKVYTYQWNELEKILAKGPEAATDERALQILSLIDTTMTSSFNEEGLPWSQSHLIDGETLHISIRFADENEYGELGDEVFSRETLLDLYAPSYKEILPLIPEIMQISISVYIGNEMEVQEFFPLEEFMEYIEKPEMQEADDESVRLSI